jgi:hypothetical protein
MEPGQRYCFECGARRGPLSSRVAGTVGALYERGRAPVVADPERDAEPEAAKQQVFERLNWRVPLGPRLPTPRAASTAVMAMLGFGVILGSLGNVSIAQLASLPSIVLNLPSSAFSSGSPSGGAGAGGGGSAPPQQQTITVVGNAPSTAAPGTSGTSAGTSTTPTATSHKGLPPVGHVFLIMLSQQGFSQTFAPAAHTYLSSTLAHEGELVYNYYGVASSPLANEIALLSGQGPTQETDANCPSYTPLIAAGTGTDGQVIGSGCVYPSTTETLADQLTAAKMTWKGYSEGLPKACSHTNKKPYAAWSNPFVYFESLKQSGDCKKDDVPLTQLKKDLKSASTTPWFSYIAPSPCDDGSNQPCTPGAASGLGPATKFLKKVVPEIEHSAAYKSSGLILITFDEAPQTGPHADSSSCCTQPLYINVSNASSPTTTPTSTTPTSTTTTPTSTTTTPTSTTTTPTSTTTTPTSTTTTPTSTTTTPTSTSTTPTTPLGGGQVGLLLISPWVKPNTTDPLDSLNHFALLEGIEELFGLKKLGYAGVSGLLTWTSSMFSGKGP